MNETTLATLSAKLTERYSKEQLQAIVTHIAGGGEIRALDMAALYAHFMPKPPSKPKDAFGWVNLAIAKKDVRKYLQYVYVTAANDALGDRVLVATDGHRAHVDYSGAVIEGLDHTGDGDYFLPNKTRIDLNANYPQVARIIPGTDELEDRGHLVSYSLERFKDSLSVVKAPRGYSCEYKYGNRVFRVNKKYLDDAMLGFVDPEIWVIDGRIYFKEGYRKAIVMGLR